MFGRQITAPKTLFTRPPAAAVIFCQYSLSGIAPLPASIMCDSWFHSLHINVQVTFVKLRRRYGLFSVVWRRGEPIDHDLESQNRLAAPA